GWASYRAILDAASNDEANAIFPRQIRDDYLARGDLLLSRARERGDLTLVTTPDIILAALYGTVVHLLVAFRMEGETISDELVDRTTGAIVALLLDRA